MQVSMNNIEELKGFIWDENRDFSTADNLILTVAHTSAFIKMLLDTEDPVDVLVEAYNSWIELLQDFPENEFLTMCFYVNGLPKWEV